MENPVEHINCGTETCDTCSLPNSKCVYCNDTVDSSSLRTASKKLTNQLDLLVVVCSFCNVNMPKKNYSMHIGNCSKVCLHGCGQLITPVGEKQHNQQCPAITKSINNSLQTTQDTSLLQNKIDILQLEVLTLQKLLISYRRNQFINTPLHTAVNSQNTIHLDILLTKVEGIELDARNERLQTPLHLACGRNFCDTYISCVLKLVKAGANVHVCDLDNNVPLLMILQADFGYNEDKYITYLQNLQKLIPEELGKLEWRILKHPKARLTEKVVKTLLNWGISKIGLTKLLEACVTESYNRGNSIEIFTLLIQSGADVNYLEEGEGHSTDVTFLSYLTSKNYVELLTILIAHGGCDINMKDSKGNTALHYSCSTTTAQILLEAGANAAITNNDNKLPAEMSGLEFRNWFLHRVQMQQSSTLRQKVSAKS
jgi:ankyrin repeat protein